MPNFATSSVLVNRTTSTAVTGNSGTLDMPQAAAYMFILDIAAGTGTTPTVDIAIQVSPDDGTTWYTTARFAQITTAATKSYKMVRNGLAYGEAAFVQAIADTGGALDKNFIFTKKVRVLWTVGGTNPAYATFKLWVVPQVMDWASR
jgi:hypothetical protein